jgi:conjugative relaxase-like TrwC/TraI family protein
MPYLRKHAPHTPHLAVNSISIIHQSGKYYLQLGKEDYYTKAVSPFGSFQGTAAKLLGIENEAIFQNDLRLKNLFRKLSPDGLVVLNQNLKERSYKVWQYKDPESKRVLTFKSFNKVPDHLKSQVKEATQTAKSITAFDNVFSAPKDFSILWGALAPNSLVREKLHNLHIQAVKEAQNYLEDNACWVRTGKNGVNKEKASVVFALFHHTTSRTLDPQLHSHLVLINLGFTESGKVLRLHGDSIFNHRYASGMIYQNSLRKGLEAEFKVVTFDRPFSDGKGSSFGIKGITEELKDAFSKRTVQIKERIHSDMSPQEVRQEVLASRQAKNFTITTKELLSKWKQEAKQLGFSWSNVIQNSPKKALPNQLNQAIATHLKQHPNPTKASSPIPKHQIVTATLSASQGKLTNKQALKAVDNFIRTYTTPLPNKTISSSTNSYFRLNQAAHKLINFAKIAASVYYTAKRIIKTFYTWHKRQRENYLKGSKPKFKSQQAFEQKMKSLYSQGRLTRKQYLKITNQKTLLRGSFKINLYEALGLISKRQAYALLVSDRIESNKKKDPILKRITSLDKQQKEGSKKKQKMATPKKEFNDAYFPYKQRDKSEKER